MRVESCQTAAVTVRFPAPLRPGDVVGVTAPSSGVAPGLRGRLDAGVDVVRGRGYDVRLGECLLGGTHVSAPAATRAAELQAMLLDPAVRAIVPPWGGETAIDLLPLLDWQAIAAAEPTWVVGFSDVSTIIAPLTLRTGVATVHGNNLMDTPYRPADGTLSWLDVCALPAGATFTQRSPGAYRSGGWDDYAGDPGVDRMTLDAAGGWTRLDGGGDVSARGRLVGGCVETICNLAGTPLLDTTALAADAPDGLLVYVEACEDNAFTICRNLHGMRLAGFFEHASAVLVGRTGAPDAPTLSQHEAVLDALGVLGVPIVADVECGHVQPFLPLVNGASATVVHTAAESTVTQTLA
ncbi:LD-carboxypeptidase [Angustibacter aerolatus]